MSDEIVADKIRVVIIDDHAVVRDGIIAILQQNQAVNVVDVGSAGNHVLELLEEYHPDVLITDLHMPAYVDEPDGDHFEPVAALETALELYPSTAIIVLTQDDSVYTIQQLAALGIKGYILKTDANSEVLNDVIERVYQGEPCFSPDVVETLESAPIKKIKKFSAREMEVIRAITLSSTMKRAEFADTLHISPNTLQHHIGSIYQKLGVRKTEAVIVYALRTGIVWIDELKQ